eukprot:gene256-461_t
MSNGIWRLRIPWNLVAMDEAHVLRNGVEKNLDEEVKLNLKTYVAINEHIFSRFRPCMLFITATVVMNHQLDAYSLARWTEMPRGLLIKSEWNNRTAMYKRSRGHMVAKHVSFIEVPPVPSITMLVQSMLRSDKESSLSTPAYNDLARKLKKLRIELSGQVRGRALSEAQRVSLKIARNAFLSAVTRCRRGELHPYFFEEKLANTVPNAEAPSALSCSSKRPPLTTEDIEKVLKEYPLSDCSKMHAVVEWCRNLTASGNQHRKGLVMCDYKQPLQILAQYLRESDLPRIAIFEHYGGGGRGNVTRIRNFQELILDTDNSEAAVLLATRGSMGVGVNLYSVQRTFLMNLAWSRADDTQALGRMQRPLVQKSHEWFATRTILDDSAAVHTSLFTVEEWMHRIQDSKQNMATELFQDSMVDVDTDDVDASPTGEIVENSIVSESNAKSMSNSLSILQDLLDSKHRHGAKSKSDIKMKRKAVRSESSGKKLKKA